MHMYLFSFVYSALPHSLKPIVHQSLVNSVVQISSLLLPHQKTNWSTPPLPHTFSSQPFCRYLALWCSKMTRSNAGKWQFFTVREGVEGSQGPFDGDQHLHAIRCKGKQSLCIISGTDCFEIHQNLCHFVNRSQIPTYSQRPRSTAVLLTLHLF